MFTDVRHRGGGGGLWYMRIHERGYTTKCEGEQRFATLACSVVDAFDRGRIKQRRVYSVHGEGKKEVFAYLII